MSVEDDLKQVEYELSRVQKNKATEHYIGNLKARLSKLLSKDTSRKTGGGSYSVKKQGNATIAFVGFPSVGKSSLLNALTNAKSQIASYEFTTLKPIPGIMHYNNTKLQLIDAPGIIAGASKGKGGGKQVFSSIRSADLLLIIIDPLKNRLPIILDELYNAGIRVNTKPPNILIKKDSKGGLIIDTTVKQELSVETFKSILKEFGFINAYVLLRERMTIDRFIDSLSNNRVYVPALIVFNKIDLLTSNQLKKLKKDNKNALFISTNKRIGFNELRKRIWETLEFKRIYLKKPGFKPDYDEPLILRGRVTVNDVIIKLKKDYSSARVWGKSVKHEGQVVSLNHELLDGDVVSFA